VRLHAWSALSFFASHFSALRHHSLDRDMVSYSRHSYRDQEARISLRDADAQTAKADYEAVAATNATLQTSAATEHAAVAKLAKQAGDSLCWVYNNNRYTEYGVLGDVWVKDLINIQSHNPKSKRLVPST
jgi:hypothetical protein